MKIQKTADNKIEIEGDSKLFALYNEATGIVIVATAPIRRAIVYFVEQNHIVMSEVIGGKKFE